MASEFSSRFVLPGEAHGTVVFSQEGLSFWGGVDPVSARVINASHPLHGACLAGAVLMMPTSRGACSGSDVWLDMAMNGRAPAALVFGEDEDVLTLGAVIAAQMFGVAVPVVRLGAEDFARAARASLVRIEPGALVADGVRSPLAPATVPALELSAADRAFLAGEKGEAARQAMRVVVEMAARQGAQRLVDVRQVHIDGCIYASPANLAFAARMADLGGVVRVSTTTNAISVDAAHWREQGVAPAFGEPAARLAEAYVRMGCAPSFTCAPYLLDSAPGRGDFVAWAESNAVIYANSVLGARTAKHPDFLDLCIALTGRAPLAGVYLDARRVAGVVIDVEWPPGADAAVWPLLGLIAGRRAPGRIPLLRGLRDAAPSRDNLKALCAAFGTTSAAPMLQIEGVTPEASAAPDADALAISRADLAAAWAAMNAGPAGIDLVAFGSPHASLAECRAIVAAFAGRRRREDVAAIVTAGRDVIAAARREGVLGRLESAGVRVLPDVCWCSISEPLFPPEARTVMTNSGKYAHYGPGLSGRAVRFGALSDCVTAACEGRAPPRRPDWAC